MARIVSVYLAVVLLVILLAACSPGTPAPTAAVTSVAEEACPQIVEQAMDATDLNCTGTGRNQICYGNFRLNLTPQPSVANLQFSQPGDIVNLSDVQSINLSSMDTTAQEWGVALMAVQANLPDSLPGQNVTILLFGNVQFENASTSDSGLAFYFQSGVGDAPCSAAPDSGILVQTPAGAERVSFRANGVDIQLGSTAYLQAQPSADMSVNVVEGEAQLTAQGTSRRVPAGTRSSVPLDANRQPSGPPSPPQPYDSSHLRVLPVTHLARPVGISSVLVSSTFAADAEGWTISGDGSPITYNAADATSDGFVCSTDQEQGIDWYFQAPDSWLGDRSAAYGGALNFALKQSADDDQYDSPDVVLAGGGLRLNYNTPDNPGTDWTAYSVPLTETAGWVLADSGQPPTRDQMMAVLSSLTALQIRGEFRTGEDTGCLDEAQLVSIVMPTARGQVIQIQPTQPPTPSRSVSGQVANATPTATSTAQAASGAQIGLEVTDTLDAPGERKPYTFTAQAGQVVYLDGMGDNANIRATITDATGAQVGSEWWLDRDNGVLTLERGGTYTITVYSVQDATGTIAFKVWNVPPPQTFTINVGDTISDGVPGAGAGRIESPGAQDIYTFTAQAGQVLYLDGLGDNANLRGQITDPTGANVGSEWWFDRDNGKITLEAGGTYTLTAYGWADTTGAYSFKMWDVTEPQAFTINVGDVVSDGKPAPGAGNIESPGAQDVYTFTAEPGQVIMFDGQAGSPSIRATLTDETGTAIFDGEWIDRSAAIRTLERGGTYTITIGSVDGTTGPYGFQVWDVPAPQTFNINIGDTVSDGEPGAGAGNIETPGVQDVYTFTAQAGQTVFFDAISGSAYIRATMTDATGAPVFENEWTDRAAVLSTLEQGGTYTITVSGVDDTVGAYSFKLWDVPPPQTFNINIGNTVSDGKPAAGAGNLESPGVQDIYTFTAQPGQTVTLTGETPDGYIRCTLTDATGAVIFQDVPVSGSSGPYMLARGGTYTLTVRSGYDTSGTYSFRLAAP